MGAQCKLAELLVTLNPGGEFLHPDTPTLQGLDGFVRGQVCKHRGTACPFWQN